MSNPRNIPIKIHIKIPERTTEIEFMQTIFSSNEKMKIETGKFFQGLAKGINEPSKLIQ